MDSKVVDAQEDFRYFAEQIKLKSGLDLTLYKQTQVQRRLTSLRLSKGYGTFRAFFLAMEQQSDLYRDFMKQLTINVTEFYRNRTHWDVLCREIAPRILEKSGRIKCWSAACSTGEEPYSLVMALASLTDMKNIEIHATDLDGDVLDKAKAGVFTSKSVAGLPPENLQRFFSREREEYHIRDEVKRRIQFRKHNLLADPFGRGYDLIVCRNVLIYFTDEAKEKIYRNFNAALNPDGYLFVGGTEQIMRPDQYGFRTQVNYFYQKSSKSAVKVP